MFKRILIFLVLLTLAIDVEALPPNSLLKLFRKTRGHLKNVDLEEVAERVWEEIKKGPPNDPREILDHVDNIHESEYERHEKYCNICKHNLLAKYDKHYRHLSQKQRDDIRKRHEKQYSRGCGC